MMTMMMISSHLLKEERGRLPFLATAVGHELCFPCSSFLFS
jgi:hypothetical protein